MTLKKRAKLVLDMKELKRDLRKHREVVMCLEGAIEEAQSKLDDSESSAAEQYEAIVSSFTKNGVDELAARRVLDVILRGEIPGVGIVDF